MGTLTRGLLGTVVVVAGACIVVVITPYVAPWIIDRAGNLRGMTDDEVAKRLQQYDVALADYEQLLADYEELASVVDVSVPGIHSARVVSHPLQSPRDTMIATIENAREGAIVYADGARRLAIGRVERAGTTSVRVQLFSAAGAEVAATVGEEAIPVIVGGVGGGEMRFTAPRDVLISVGDSVRVNGGASSIGVVADVSVNESDSEQTVRLHLPINGTTIRFVYYEA